MAVSRQTPLPAAISGIVAFQLLTQLMALLEAKGVLTNAERANLCNNAASGLSPPNDPRVQAMKQTPWATGCDNTTSTIASAFTVRP
jgi:hypothetical protein